MTFERFKEIVKDSQPHVIHFIGHGKLEGGTGKLAFMKADGTADWKGDFPAAAAASKALKLVFLQACESALPDPHTPISGVARQCAFHNIPAVVAMQAKIENKTASTFAIGFYDALAKSETVECAVLLARHAIDGMLKKQSAAFGVPVLYLRSFDKLIGPKLAAQIPVAVSQGECLCPRCGGTIPRDNPKFCPYCQLRFHCTEASCGHRLADPFRGKICDECGAVIQQKPWEKASQPQERAPAFAPLNKPDEVAQSIPGPLPDHLTAFQVLSGNLGG